MNGASLLEGFVEGGCRLVRSAGAMNYVEFRGGIYEVPQSLGPVDLRFKRDREKPGVRLVSGLMLP